MHPSRWGDPARAAALSETARGLVELVFPVADRTVPDDADVVLPAPGLAAAALADLAEIVGWAHVHTDDLSVPEVAEVIARSAGLAIRPDTDGVVRARLRRYRTSLAHIHLG